MENTKNTNKKEKTNKRKKVGGLIPGKTECNDKVYKVGSKSCVWICPNARLKDHKCKFALCDKCYIGIAPIKRRQRGQLHNNVQKGGDLRCNHKAVLSLDQFFDDQYFKDSWKNKMNLEKGFFPSQCDECKREFVS